MGLLYIRATEVISWLGEDDETADYLETLQTNRPAKGRERHRFCTSDYWDRAWVTQEVALGGRVTLCAGQRELEAQHLKGIFEGGAYSERTTNQLPPHAYALQGRSLVYLMDHFKHKESGVQRNHIHSLLALCDDGSDLQVDYDTSHDTLACHVLKSCRKSFCLCAIHTVARVLHLHYEGSGPLDDPRSLRPSPLAQITVPSLKDISLERTCSARACQKRDCDSTPQSHDAGFTFATSAAPGTVSVSFSIDRICKSRLSYVCSDWMEIDIGLTLTYRMFHHRNDSPERPSPVRIGDRRKGCTAIISDLKRCTVSFSLDFLLEISEFYARDDCCDRVTNLGTESVRPQSESTLRLYV
jgi:hypothetical protein